jgi:3-methyladenine DNA glycosylase/8-oxoguanine DNA glycosylase
MDDRSTLRVLVFPADDIALRHEIDRALAEVDSDLPETHQIADLEDRLRPWYRSLTIRARDTLGGYDDDPTRVWYVYRDGRIRARHDALERLYRALAEARSTMRASASAIERAKQVSGRAGYPTDRGPLREAFDGVSSALDATSPSAERGRVTSRP